MTNIKNKKILIPAIAAITLLAVVVGAFNPISALADPFAKNQEMPEITGSVNIADTMKDYIKEHRTTSFSDAATTAEKQVSNGVVVGGHVGIIQGYLVYTFGVIDTESDAIYMIMIDAGNGTVLHKSEGISMKEMGGFGPGPLGSGFGGHGFGGPDFGHGFDKKMMSSQDWSDKTDSENSETQ